jgi:predicted ATPase/DNA-binding winged helix-turn-helix (wHTH) protein
MAVTMTTPVYVFNPYRLVPAQRLLECGGATVRLGGRAFDMLVSLVERRDRIVSKVELMDLVWPKLVVEENNLQVQIVALRKLLGHPAIATVPGRGYRFTLPVVVEGAAEATGLADEAPPAEEGARRRTNLLQWLPVLYGRDQDLATLLELSARHDLVTVAGPGGIGKTRLAQAAAAARIADLPGGAWWVELASLTEPALVPNAVALALGVGLGGAGDATAAVIAGLPSQPALLVLDNAEHLLPGVVDFLARVRPAAPHLRLLVTSQETLHVAGEHVFRPEPLALPEGDDPERIGDSGAVALFVARAQAADRRFVLDAGNRAAVADVCRRLDGIPLAIELAAARIPLLGIEGLRSRLDQRFNVLTSGDRGSLRRHQTLRAALEWSYQLLSTPEQAVLRRLGVFAGGFTLEAAQQVAEDEHGIDRWDVLEHLGALVDKSLVRAEGDALPRYRMLETTRLFALERLIESDEAAGARTRHRDHFLEVAEEARVRMVVGDPRGLAVFDGERDNLFLALAWLHGDDDGNRSLRLAAATRYYWTSRGMFARGLEAMRSVLSWSHAQPPSAARCQVLGTAAHISSLMGQQDDALHHIAEALTEARGLGDERCLCMMLSGSGFIELRRGETARAALIAQEALALGRQIGDSHELGNAITLMAAVHHHAGELEPARQMQLEGVALRRRMHHLWSEAVGHLNLAGIAFNRDEPATALPHLRRVLELTQPVDSQQIGLYLIGATAEWCACAGQNEAAVLLEAARLAHYQRVGMADAPDPAQARRLEGARAMLDDASRERLQLAGGALGYREALQEVRDRLAAGGAPEAGAAR